MYKSNYKAYCRILYFPVSRTQKNLFEKGKNPLFTVWKKCLLEKVSRNSLVKSLAVIN